VSAGRREWAPVAALTLVGFVLRAVGLDQALYGDEIFTYDIVTQNGLLDVLREVRQTSITPPLHYAVGWSAVQLGDPITAIRLPSLILGTATVPLVFAIGRRAVGPGAALVATALMALSPFAVWYGVEARAYATMVFAVAVSMYGLLRALDSERPARAWWLVFVIASASALYAHYTAAFVLATQVAWGLWSSRGSGRWREVALAGCLVFVAYLPWVPFYLDQRGNPGIYAIDALFPLTLESALESPLNLVVGQPFTEWNTLLGPVGTAVLGLAGAVVVAGAAIAVRSGRPAPEGWVPNRALLVAGLALATPVGLIVYAALGTSLYAPRNLSASLPAICLALGALTMRIEPRAGRAAALLLLAAVGLASARGLQDEHQRPPYKEIAARLDREAGPRDAVLVATFGTAPTDFFGRDQPVRTLAVNLEREPASLSSEGIADGPALRRLADGLPSGSRLFVVSEEPPGLVGKLPAPEFGPRLSLRSRTIYPAFAPVRFSVYRVR
jgi:4-amino-4-deoxy-L-arabinose transferase-like glycosyltransferase